MIREKIMNVLKEVAEASSNTWYDLRGALMSHLAKKLVKEPTLEERNIINFAVELLHDELETLGALNPRVSERARKMGPDMVKISKIADLGSGAAGHHDRKAEVVRLAETTDVHKKLAVVLHEFVHHLFLNIRRGRVWMGVDEGLVEGFSQHILRKHAQRIFERFPIDRLPYDDETPMERRLDIFWQTRTAYVDQVDTMRDVAQLVAAHEKISKAQAEEDMYRTLLGVIPFRVMAKRVESACGPGALRLLRGMLTPHQGLRVDDDTASRSIIPRLIAPTYVSSGESLPPNTPILTTEHMDAQTLPPSGMDLHAQYKYMRTRFLVTAERCIAEGPPYNAQDTADLTRALKNLILWRKMHLEDARDVHDDYKRSIVFERDRAEFRRRYGKQTRALVSRIRAALRDNIRLSRE